MSPFVEGLGLDDAVWFSPQRVTVEWLAGWYRSLDVLLSIGNEGFGLPTVEAQACGVPVIGLAAAATSELVRSGMQVGGQEWWNYAHQAWWVTPDVGQVAAQLRKARSRPRACALVGAYGAEEVFRCHWKPALDKLLA